VCIDPRTRVIEGVQAADFHTLIGSGRQPHVVLADVNLFGDVNGIELSHAVRQTHPDIDVILTSGVTGAAQLATQLSDEFDGSARHRRAQR